MLSSLSKKFFIRVFYILIILILVFGGFYLNSLLPIITGYPARHLCSAIFISHRTQEEVEATDLNFSFIRFTTNRVNMQEKSVTSTFLWGRSKAIFREGLGAVLIREAEESALKSAFSERPRIPEIDPDTIAWPLGNRLNDSVSFTLKNYLQSIADSLVNRQSYGGTPFAFLVIHKGQIVSEQYRAGFSDSTRFLSWSMAKSFTNALIGLQVAQGKLAVDMPAGIEEWQHDNRKTITIGHLLRMESGLDWNEDYGNRSDVTLMLYRQGNFSMYAAAKVLKETPGKIWDYSSGTTNILCRVLRQHFPSDQALYDFIQYDFLTKIGIRNAVFETDVTGIPVGSSYLFATAREYGRFGLLYLNMGMFAGQRILPEEWVRYSVTPVPSSKGAYGAHFWLNRNHFYTDAPEDMFSANGHDGQRIFIIPSQDLVVVILGYSPKPDHTIDFNRLLRDIIREL
jgi:CubicO group peptidase (beta-lactamase class C family)